jgi:hypothetical protein
LLAGLAAIFRRYFNPPHPGINLNHRLHGLYLQAGWFQTELFLLSQLLPVLTDVALLKNLLTRLHPGGFHRRTGPPDEGLDPAWANNFPGFRRSRGTLAWIWTPDDGRGIQCGDDQARLLTAPIVGLVFWSQYSLSPDQPAPHRALFL